LKPPLLLHSNDDALPPNWEQQAQQALLEGNYDRAAELYERAIDRQPEVKSYYWHLGLICLLQGQEAEAQMTWLMAMAEGESEEVERWTEELIGVLDSEARRREELTDYETAWAIRQHIRELLPTNLDNLLELARDTIRLNNLTGDEIKEWGIVDLLTSTERCPVNSELLTITLREILETFPFHSVTIELAEACSKYIQKSNKFFYTLLPTLVEIADNLNQPIIAARFVEICARLSPKNLTILRFLAVLYQDANNWEQGLKIARQCYALAESLPERIFANHLILRALMKTSGQWNEVYSIYRRHQYLLQNFIQSPPNLMDPNMTRFLFSATFYFPYIRDDPRQNRYLQGKTASICQAHLQAQARDFSDKYRQHAIAKRQNASPTKTLKIGYLSSCLKQHSVGWLARWLIQYHNSDRFETYGYFISAEGVRDRLLDWYCDRVSHARRYGSASSATCKITEHIYQDDIDILVDLDSLTQDSLAAILALKPAPVQLTWLGWDASGVPAIDYFIADPYVLPESAESYYSERIWRFPQTYIAVDGFEIGVPTLSREGLGIPQDSVIYLTVQQGTKQNPDTVRLQLKIIKAVPNSYFLVKSVADRATLESFFYQLAELENVAKDRIRFLPRVATEAEHRANLAIADVVLDTYPYNGATTTLETLWVGVPLVTRVGQQFSSRNSYTMMTNAGISEGIAWTDEEYIEWGVRLGRDPQLRQHIAWKLRQSRQTSPLWNGEQFTREMENAYEQMWQRYLESR
jgi:predicted O-linked N-acetylglucosamine transferase (SPINDLY family)